MTKFCGSCHQNKSISEFAKNTTKKSGLQVYCKECQKQKDKERYPRTKESHALSKKLLRRRNQLAVHEYLTTHPCVDCPASDPDMLSFDHVRGEKLGNVSDIARKPSSLQTIFEEIAKCEVRCFNCHMKKDCTRLSGAGLAKMSGVAPPASHQLLASRKQPFATM